MYRMKRRGDRESRNEGDWREVTQFGKMGGALGFRKNIILFVSFAPFCSGGPQLYVIFKDMPKASSVGCKKRGGISDI